MNKTRILNYNKILFAIIITSIGVKYNASATSINSYPLGLYEETDEITFKCLSEATKISFCFEEDTIVITPPLNIEHLMPDAINIYTIIGNHWRSAAQTNAIRDTVILTDSTKGINLLDSSFSLDNQQSFVSKTRITCKNTVAEIGGNALFVAPVIHTSNFFLTTPGTVEFKAYNPKGYLTGISFAFPRKTQRPFTCMLEGSIDFNNLSNPNPLLVLGAESITFKLSKPNLRY